MDGIEFLMFMFAIVCTLIFLYEFVRPQDTGGSMRASVQFYATVCLVLIFAIYIYQLESRCCSCETLMTSIQRSCR